MHIDELENYNLADAVGYHDELNPGLWGKDEHLRPEVREALLRIADDFREFLGVDDLEVKDITISGSNAAFNYTPTSDIDLHLVVNIPELNDEVYRELFNAKKYQYNDQHDIRVRGADVELYVQPAEDKHVSQGIYSVANQKWLSVPRRQRAAVDDDSVRHKAEDLEARIQQAISSGNREVMDSLWQKIKDIRKSGLEQKGEFSTENLVFKILRVNGLIERLQTARQSARDQELSLSERKRKKSRKRYAYGGYWYPGFGYAGSSEAGSDSGGDGGGESVREDVGSTWDGVSPTTRMFTSEQENNKSVITSFARFVAKQIGMRQLPRIRITRNPKWSGENGTFGHYDQTNKTLTISLANRHIMDVLRTMAHELVHAHQDREHGLPSTAGKTGSPYENEANAVAGRIMRRWAKKHGNMFDQPATEDYDPNARPPGPETKPTMPAGTVRVDVSDVYDWYKLGQHISDLEGLGKHDFGKGPPSAIFSFGDEDTEHKYIRDLKRTGLDVTDIDPRDPNQPPGMKKIKTDPTYDVDEDLKSTLGAAAAAACIAGTPGCATTNTDSSPTADVLRGVQTVGRTAQAVKDMGVGGAKEELINQLRDKLRGIREATGYIPTKKQARDPRFSMALTQDIQPGQIGKEANKLKLDTDSQGHPALLMKRLNNLLESVKTDEQLDEDELFELKMSPSNLARMARDIDARAGLEFEMYVPNVNADDEEFESEPDYGADESFPTGPGWQQDIIDFFRGGDMSSPRVLIQRAIDALNENFYAWVYEQEEEFIESNEGRERAIEIATLNVDREDYKTDEEYEAAVSEYLIDKEDDIRNELIDEFRDDLDSKFEEWLDDDGINSMADFANEYGLEWPYWTEQESSRSGTDIDDVARDFQDAIGRKVKTGGYHSGAYSQTDNYRVETDSSLSDADDYGDAGLEFISPPLTIPEMLSDIKKITAWANRVGAYTNDTTGLHMNISVPGYSMQKLDYVKLAMFLGDNYVLEQFGRAGNTYCKSALNKIKAEVKQDPARLKNMLQAMQGELNSIASKIVHTGNTDKYTSINTKDNRVEFRSPGGDYLAILANDPAQITNTLLRTVVALDVAMKPEAFRQEYMKKLYKTLTPTEFTGGRGERQTRVESQTNQVADLLSKYIAGELPQSVLKSFIKDLQKKRSDKKVPPESPTSSQDQDFTGVWEIVNRNTDEVVSIMSGLGNSVADAEAHAANWVRDTGFDDPIYVRPRMQPRTAPPDVSIYQIVNYQDGEVLSPGRSMHWNYARAVADDIARRRGMGRADIRIVDLENNQTYSFEGRLIQPSVRATAGEPVPAGSVGGGFNRAPHTSIYQLIDNRNGQIMLGGETRTFADTVEKANILMRDYRLTADDIRIVDMYTNTVYDINGRPVSGNNANTSSIDGEQSTDANYEIIDLETRGPVFRFIANTDQEAQRKFIDWLEAGDRFIGQYYWRRIEGRGIPGSTAELQRQRAQPQFTVDYTTSRNGDVMNNRVTVTAANADAAMASVRDELEASGYRIDRIEADPVEQSQARGTESLPPGNTRWLVLDQNDREVYSFVHRSNQGEANQYAVNWLRQNGLLGSGEFMVVPAR